MNMFFSFWHNDSHTRGNPWAMSVDSSRMRYINRRCRLCGTSNRGRYEGEAIVYLEGGTKWSDIIGLGGSPNLLIVSEQVIGAFHREGVGGFDEQPVCIAESKSKRLNVEDAPHYFYINVNGLMEIDIEASNADGAKQCPECHHYKCPPAYPANRFVPMESTWDGSDIFGVRNLGAGWGYFCTEKVLLLARKHKWTNFRFEPMDAIRRHATSWKGIDYLGRKWPPKEWYPPAPSKGKPLAEWLDVFRENTYQAAPCHDALLDFEEEAVPPMVQFLHEGTDVQRKGAARVLYYLCYTCGVQLPKGVEDVLKKEMPDLYKY